VEPNLAVPGHPESLSWGHGISRPDGIPLPGVAQVALQQGKIRGQIDSQTHRGRTRAETIQVFRQGNMAVVGKGFAVLQTGKIHLSGFVAWLAWAACICSPGNFQSPRERFRSVGLDLSHGATGSRLIVNHHGADKGNRSAEAPVGAAAATK